MDHPIVSTQASLQQRLQMKIFKNDGGGKD
jgi:hypothetical protein